MNYEGQICRPPMEKASFMLPVSVGCAYNICKFCTLFKHVDYRLLPLDQVETELRRVQSVGGKPKQVFLGDGNALAMPTDRLLQIMFMIREYLPSCEMVNLDATVTDIERKSDEELLQLCEAGLKRLYLGIESGLPSVLDFMLKDHNLESAVEQIERLRQAGLSFNAHIMTGLAGQARGEENAEKLALFFNQHKPERIINFSLFLHEEAPLYNDIERGDFQPASELENLKEARRLIDLLDTALCYDGLHDAIAFRVRGELPRDRSRMLQKLDKKIEVQSKLEPVYAFDTK